MKVLQADITTLKAYQPIATASTADKWDHHSAIKAIFSRDERA
jgi:hypothetical protein